MSKFFCIFLAAVIILVVSDYCAMNTTAVEAVRDCEITFLIEFWKKGIRQTFGINFTITLVVSFRFFPFCDVTFLSKCLFLKFLFSISDIELARRFCLNSTTACQQLDSFQP